MDKHFLEFWGNFLINAAKEQKQLEDINQWIHKCFKGFEDLTAMFRKFYDLDKLTEDTPDALKVWKQVQENFQKPFSDFLSFYSVVPMKDHLKLVKKYEALKEKVALQEETIRHLKMLLNDKSLTNYGLATMEFQDPVKKQSEQFQKTMESFGQFFK